MQQQHERIQLELNLYKHVHVYSLLKIISYDSNWESNY